MPVALRGTVNSSFRLGAGTVSSPSLAFGNATSTGIFLQNGNIGFSVSGIEKLRLTSDGLMVTGNIIASNYSGNGSSLSGLPDNTFVSNIQVANSTYVALDDSSVDTNGGYIVCNGSGFLGGSMVLVDGTPVPATSVLSYTQLGAQVPSKAAGTYSVSVVRPDSVSISVPLGITYSPFPAWSTSTTLANVIKTIAFTQTLAATEATGANVTYAISSGSSLPANVSLASNGLLSGNIVSDPGNSTTYSFSLDAIDTQLQNIPRTFSLLALPPYIIATGGTITTSGGYTYHTFTTSGTFTLTSNPYNKTFDILVVAGGGGGGSRHAGGGGGGGVISSSSGVSAGAYVVTVGAGGTGGKLTWNGSNYVETPPTTSGTNSSIGSLFIAIGGGVGGGGGGGSGGGGTGPSGGGSGTTGQGFAGGAGTGSGAESTYTGGGGGGSNSVGGGGNTAGYGGNGGNGVQTSISGSVLYYAGGGGGGISSSGVTAGSGGLGGGGAGSKGTANATAGTINTGGGGGGAGLNGLNQGFGGNGGSGIVIIRYIP